MSDMDPGGLITEARTRAGLTQQQLADRSGMAQPAIARLERGHVSPTFTTVERLVAASGFALRIDLLPITEPDAVVERYKRDVDRTLLRENLRKSVDDRLRSLVELQDFGHELRRAVRAGKKGRR
jgi:transcriptional regulator with XRE-family HTH domain